MTCGIASSGGELLVPTLFFYIIVVDISVLVDITHTSDRRHVCSQKIVKAALVNAGAWGCILVAVD